MDLIGLKDKLKEIFLYNPEKPLLFNSESFLFIFLAFLGIYIILANRKTIRVIYVLAFSLFFYYKSSGMFFILLLVSTVIDFTLGILIHIYHSENRNYRKARVWPLGTIRILDLSKEFTIQLRPWLGPYYGKLVSRSFLFLSIILTGIDNLTSRFVPPENNKKKRLFYLITSVVANLGLLAYFKYTNFFIGTINEVAGSNITFAKIFLPVGISFFTFQTMSYTIDIYRKRLDPVINILDFGFFVSFFPQLVAGPIVRAVDFLPQIRDKIRVTQDDIGRGLLLICTGLFKKAVISDYISVNFVDRVFENPSLYSGFENLMSIYGYALQIYCDFSGYSDMAIGIGLLLGFRLPINFMAPYQSKSIQEFWRRWHISLSSWLRDYLYISMGGNRKGKKRTYINLMMTMVLGGLWHGASWKFVFWGFMHGIALAIDRLMKDTKAFIAMKFMDFMDYLDRIALEREKGIVKSKDGGTRIRQIQWFMQGWFSLVISMLVYLSGIFFTFHFICFCWVFFRAESFAAGWEMINQILTNFQGVIAWQVLSGYKEVFMLMILGYILHFLPNDIDLAFEKRFIASPMFVKSLTLAVIIWMVLQTRSADIQPFIYYQF